MRMFGQAFSCQHASYMFAAAGWRADLRRKKQPGNPGCLLLHACCTCCIRRTILTGVALQLSVVVGDVAARGAGSRVERREW